MDILFLGTGAPEGNPSPFCDCQNCQYVRKHKGKNIRLQSSVLINNDLLIDFGPDVTRCFNNLGFSMSGIKNVLVTHCHHDHFYPGNLFNRLKGPRTRKISDLHIYGPARIKTLAKEWISKAKEQKVFLHAIKPFENMVVGKYSIKPLPITQNDKFAGEGMCYIVSDGQKTILYAVDTYGFPKENWPVMKGLIFDAVILDETFGYKDPPNRDHNNITLFLKTIRRLKEEGLTHKKTKFYTQHMSHHNPPHEKFEKIMAESGVVVPHDGFRAIC